MIAAFGGFAVGFALRALIGGRREDPPVRRAVRWIENTPPVRLVLAPPTTDELTDDELDNLILIPAMLMGTGLLLGGTLLLGLDSVGTQLIFFQRG